MQTNKRASPHLLSFSFFRGFIRLIKKKKKTRWVNSLLGKLRFWATSRMFTSPFDTIFRVRGRRERGREGLRGEDCDSACDGHVYPGGGRKGRRVITDWSGELLRWMPDNKLLQDQFLEFEESWPSCGKKMRGRKDGVEGSGRPTVTRTSKASSPFQHSSLILSELLSRSSRGVSFSRFQSSNEQRDAFTRRVIFDSCRHWLYIGKTAALFLFVF